MDCCCIRATARYDNVVVRAITRVWLPPLKNPSPLGGGAVNLGIIKSNIWNKVNIQSTSLKLFFVLFPSIMIIIIQIFVILESCY